MQKRYWKFITIEAFLINYNNKMLLFGTEQWNDYISTDREAVHVVDLR